MESIEIKDIYLLHKMRLWGKYKVWNQMQARILRQNKEKPDQNGIYAHDKLSITMNKMR